MKDASATVNNQKVFVFYYEKFRNEKFRNRFLCIFVEDFKHNSL